MEGERSVRWCKGYILFWALLLVTLVGLKRMVQSLIWVKRCIIPIFSFYVELRQRVNSKCVFRYYHD